MDNFDFDELRNDVNFIEKITNFSESLDKIDENVTNCLENICPNYDELTTAEKVKIDLFLSYTMNSLYWMVVKINGTDPNNHGIKNELSRIRQSMVRDKQIYERNTIRPVLDKDAAGRFIRHGLKTKRKKDNDESDEIQEVKAPPPQQNKRIKFIENISDSE